MFYVAIYDNQPAASAGENPAAATEEGATGGPPPPPPSQPQQQKTINELKELPFQLQIKYTDLEGAQALRVITQTMPITTDRIEAENGTYSIVLIE